MNVWKIETSTKYHRLNLVWERDAKVILELMDKPFGDSWRPLPVQIEPSEAMANFPPGLASGVLLCDKRALEFIQPLIAKSAEVLPLHSQEGNFYIVNITDVIDCLDHSASEFEYFRSGDIKRILRYIFKSDCINGKPIFKIREKQRGPIYVSDEFKAHVESNKLTGLTFRKVWEGG
jgi:hypothetical protein